MTATILIFLAITGKFCDANMCGTIEQYSYVTHGINEFLQTNCQQSSAIQILRAGAKCDSIPFLLEIEFIRHQPVCYIKSDKYPNLEQPELTEEKKLKDEGGEVLILLFIFFVIYAVCDESSRR
uniref:Uncharacterized protein n=1 Tax=Ceratitis capitata TaxID=7213 RepID=W8BP78_CERCA